MSLTRRYFKKAKMLEAAYGTSRQKKRRRVFPKKKDALPKPHRKPATMRATR